MPAEDEYLVPAHARYSLPGLSESVDVAVDFVRYATLDSVIDMVTDEAVHVDLVQQLSSGEILKAGQDELPLRFQNMARLATKFLRQLGDYKSNPQTEYALMSVQVTTTGPRAPEDQ